MKRLLLLAGLAALGSGCATAAQPPAPPAQTESPLAPRRARVRTAAAAGSLGTVEIARASDGGEEKLVAPGRVTVVDLWATWCSPCVKAMPAWQAIAPRLEEAGARLVAVSMDEERERADAFARRHGLTFPILWDPNGSRLGAAYPLDGIIPTTLVVDCAGKVRKVYRGWDGPAELEGVLEQARVLSREAACN